MTNHFNYDPNLREGKHTVRVTYGVWAYRATWETTVGGNTHGGSILEWGIEEFINHHLEIIEESGGYGDDEGGVWEYELVDAEGGVLSGEVFGTASECRHDIERMVLGVEIIAYVPDLEEEARRAAQREARYAAAREKLPEEFAALEAKREAKEIEDTDYLFDRMALLQKAEES